VPSGQPVGTERTLAEYAAEEKNAVSHRALAFRALVPHLKEHLRS
jgi:XTP/dITP diphosphohydrolase